MPNSLKKRYTPPTCTLEILAEGSSWRSWWSRKSVVPTDYFQLRFDDPRLPKSQQVTIAGDRQQLDFLTKLVTDYVHSFLKASGNWSKLDQDFSLKSPFLQAKTLMEHELSLDFLSPEYAQHSVILSPSQLVDLANALEQYQQEIKEAPALTQSSRPKLLITIGVSLMAILGLILTVTSYRQNSSLNVSRSNPAESEGLDSVSPTPEQEITLPPAPVFPEVSPSLPPSLATPAPISPPPQVNSAEESASPAIPSPTPRVSPVPTNSEPDRLAAVAPPSPLTDLGPVITPSPTSESPRQIGANVVSTPLEQVENYFQQRWVPPAELTEKLEYRLLLNREGNLQEITPLGQLAKDYQQNINLPLVGEKLVTPGKKLSNLRIRLVLYPNGTLQAFYE